jgi:Mrp family chromosome partitioning ATPase
LNSILNGKRLWEACVWRASLPFAVLDLIHAGRPSAAGDLHENRKHLLGELRQAFDFIVIDSAAFPPTSDVLSWAELADGVLSVMRLQHTPRSLAKDHLARVSGFAQSFAVIINDAPLAGRPRVALTEIVQEPAEVLAQSNEITRTGPIGGSSRAAASDVQELLTVLPGGGHQTPVPTRWDRLGRKSD